MGMRGDLYRIIYYVEQEKQRRFDFFFSIKGYNLVRQATTGIRSGAKMMERGGEGKEGTTHHMV